MQKDIANVLVLVMCIIVVHYKTKFFVTVIYSMTCFTAQLSLYPITLLVELLVNGHAISAHLVY